MLLSLPVVPSNQFSWKTNEGTTERSDLRVNIFSQIYDDACDAGFIVKSEKTGREFIAFHSHSEFDNEGELQYDVFTFWSEKKNNRAVQLKREERFKVLVFND